MIIEALNRYYEIILNDPNADIAPRYYSKVKIRFGLNINEQGDLINLIPQTKEVTVGKKTYEDSLKYIVPQSVNRTSGTLPNFLWDNSGYVLGIDDKGKPNKTNDKFNSFKNHNVKLLKDIESSNAQAVVQFLLKWNPLKALENYDVNYFIDEIYKNNFCFIVNGKYVHDDPLIKEAWEQYNGNIKDENIGICSITGIKAAIEKVHPSIKNVKGAQSSGAAIVTFNKDSFKYGVKEQGLNSPISREVAFNYTTILNSLLSSNNQKILISDTTMVFWADSSSTVYYDVVNLLFTDPNESDKNVVQNKKIEHDIYRYIKNALEGKPSKINEIDESTNFYILGLAPNAGRISIRFFFFNNFGKFVSNLSRHYLDLQIIKEWPNDLKYIPVWKILSETVPTKSKEKESSPLLSGALIRSIIEGKRYPRSLYNAIMLRIKADRIINYTRVAIIKAYLIRSIESYQAGKEEVLTMSLNQESRNIPYLLGRMFAVLEKAQKDAVGDANATIKDRYFSSACSTPAMVFPTLLKLSQSHMSKTSNIYADKLLQDLLQRINEVSFPKYLTLEEQGIFIIGYYHQKADIYSKKENKKE